MTKVVRVAVSNNFNCTNPEWAQLHQYQQDNPNSFFFINSNIRTPKLFSINTHNNKAVITVNPDLIPNNSYTKKLLYQIDKTKIAFLRIKWLPNNPEIKKLVLTLSKSYPVVITLQRFNKLEHILPYTNPKHYQWNNSRYRLSGLALAEITDLVDHLTLMGRRVWICDRKGLGCQGCGLCSLLTTGQQDLPVYSLNLSSSGICPYNCPDCYAKTMQHFCKEMGHNPIRYNNISKNDKQSGKTAHIKEAQNHE